MAKAKTINLLVNDGTLNGVISIEDSNWNKGELYSAPRESVADLIPIDACSRYGVSSFIVRYGIRWSSFRPVKENKTTYHREVLVGKSCNSDNIR